MAATSTLGQVTGLLAQLGGLAMLAATLAAAAAIVYRWYVRDVVPRGLSLLVGLSGVAVYLNTTTALGQVIGGSTAPTEAEVALFNIAAFLVGAGAAAVGRGVGDRFGSDVVLAGTGSVESDVGRLVRSVGRARTVELPAEIDDVVGYDPVPAETKETLAGKTFTFPRGLTVEEVRGRLVARLTADYAVGHVDAEFDDDGNVRYLALGSRAAGIGPTLPPATTAVAIRADPAFAASAGDLVQVWETDPMRRVLTGELRGVAGDTVTVAIDAADTPKVDPTEEYRLVTLPVDDRPDREFASLLRAADETVSSVAVEAGSPLHGLPVGALSLAVVAVEREGDTVALPDPSYRLASGDVVFAMARPEALRRLEVAAEPLDPALVRQVADPPDGSTDAGEQPGAPTADEGGHPSASAGPPAADRPGESTTEAGTGSPAERPGDEIGTDEPDETAAEADTADDPTEADAAEGGDEPDGPTPENRADADSFQQLKEEFESGDADWADSGDEGGTDTDFAFGGAEADGPADGEPVEDPADAGGTDGEDPLAGDELFADDDGGKEDGGGDDLAALSVDEDQNEDELPFDDGDETEEEFAFDDGEPDGDEEESDGEDDGDDGDDDDDDGDDDDDDEGDDDSGGGGGSFQELKEEFESGDADWADEVSDSPGGDMRLDE